MGIIKKKKEFVFFSVFFFFYEGVVHFQVMLPSHLCLSSTNQFFSTKDSNDVVTAIKLIPTISQ